MATGANEQFAVIETFKAARDLSAYQYRLVSISADDTVDVSAAYDSQTGVLQNKPAAAGRAARVLFIGKTKIYLGNTVAVKEWVMAAASGWAVKALSGYTSVGFCTKAANSGYVGEAIIVPTEAALVTAQA